MKSIYTHILNVLILSIGLTSCSSQKKLQTEVPFEIGTATVQEWMGGKEESGTGYLVSVSVLNITKDVRFQEMFYHGQVVQVTTESHGHGLMVKGNFTLAPQKPDIIMHADPRKEVGNQPPSMQKGYTKDLPFDLEPQEAVLSYMIKNRVKYVKISGMKEKAPLIYSTKPKN
ncbi:hypothetical protein SB49_11765 [Sediminicola sp. YIK13]|uniref:hypothetical protein n=1 Tax=Sediminicola sp. YIK13 TaxID=1453352 RepID=UPI0007218E5A|nr:hypothetical protein [Sediminicola sp. YIK13]ALM08412.1 hypothetical protein SB49_11765 [Sediminicola sp. YIK13]